MNRGRIVCPVAFLQAHYARLFMVRHKLTAKDFLKLNKEKNILGFLELGYESFHLTGAEGVLLELDAYVFGSSPYENLYSAS